MIPKQLLTTQSLDSTNKLRSEEHTSELQSLAYLVCRLLLEKKKHHQIHTKPTSTSNTLFLLFHKNFAFMQHSFLTSLLLTPTRYATKYLYPIHDYFLTQIQ